MRNVTSLLSASLLVGLFVACSPEQRNYGNQGGAGGTGGIGTGGVISDGGGGSSSFDLACQTYAQDFCNRAAQCSPAAIEHVLGNWDTCVSRYSLFCNAVLSSNGTGWTPDSLMACSASYASLDCNLFLASPFRNADELTPPACAPPPGALPDGAACFEKAQCQSGNCHHAAGAFCGICGPRVSVGDPCTNTDDCQAHQICWGGKCAPAGEPGEACDLAGGTPCAAPWPCFGGTCSKPGQLGDTCGGNGPDCALLQGLSCNLQTYQCVAITYAPPDMPCAPMDPTPTQCAASGVCKNGVCVGHAADGAPCDPAAGPICMFPAACVNGTCVVPDPALCQ